ILVSTGKAAERVALYRDALDYRTANDEKIATLKVVAKIEEEELRDDDAAVATFRAVLDVDETDVTSLDALARVFVRRERWRDLAELHRRRAEQSALPDDEARWRLELARVLDQKLEEPAAAIDELEAVIGLVSAVTSDVGRTAVLVLESMLARDEQKARVLDLLKPIYEAADDWRKLVDVA